MKKVNLLEIEIRSGCRLPFSFVFGVYMLPVTIFFNVLLYEWEVMKIMPAVLETEAAPDQTRPLYFNQLTN